MKLARSKAGCKHATARHGSWADARRQCLPTVLGVKESSGNMYLPVILIEASGWSGTAVFTSSTATRMTRTYGSCEGLRHQGLQQSFMSVQIEAHLEQFDGLDAAVARQRLLLGLQEGGREVLLVLRRHHPLCGRSQRKAKVITQRRTDKPIRRFLTRLHVHVCVDSSR